MEPRIFDMDSRRVRLPHDPLQSVRVAPGTDFSKREEKLRRHDPRPQTVQDLLRRQESPPVSGYLDLLLALAVIAAFAFTAAWVIYGMAGAL